MNRIDKTFKRDKVFIAYLIAGQKGLDYSFNVALSLIESGVDLLEVGVPFSDPVADGPVIQRAMNDALVRKVTILDALELIKRIRKYTDIPLVLFSYLNPILQFGYNRVFKLAKDSGVDGTLIVDLPVEESIAYVLKCKKYKIAPIFVVAPSTTSGRIRQIDKHAQGFLYYACRKGTTGMKKDLPADFAKNVRLIKRNSKLPVVVGFGVSSRRVAKKIINIADGFVVGSLFVDKISQGVGSRELKKITLAIEPRRKRKV